MKSEYQMILVTVPVSKTAVKLAGGLLKKKLAACINIVKNVQSIYWWQGKIEKSLEELLIIKTKAALSGQIISHVKKNHPYAVAEVIAFDIKKGSSDYLKWISSSCGTKKTKKNPRK
jgi:periplasmic divalent cation tolerance protein